MELKLKTNTKVSYISEYIKYKFPMYVGKMNSVSFMGLVNNIQFISDIKNVGFEQLKNGNKDEIIDNYVNQYMKVNFPNVFETVNKLCIYICGLLKNNKKFNDSISLLNDISNQIGYDCFNQIDISLVKSGKYDEMFYTRYLEIINQIKNHFISHVNKVICSMNENVGFSNDTINVLISKIVNDMLNKYDSNKVYDDNRIREKYLNLSNEIKINVKEHIKKVLYNMDLVIGVDTDKVINDLLYMTTVSGQMSAIGLINGKLDNLICGHANKNRKHSYNDSDIVDYIYNYLNNIADEEITENQLMDFSKEVKKILKSDKYGYNVSHILDHQCDGIINQLYEERYHSYFIDRNDWVEDYSKKKNNKKSIIYKPKKKSIQKIIAGILLGSSLLVLSGCKIKNVKNDRAIDNAKSLGRTGGYSIDYSSKHDEELSYGFVANDVLMYYDHLVEYGPEYIHLCFYNAYCDGLSLDELNHVIGAVKDFIVDDEKYAELNSLMGDSNLYIDYIYNSLIMMGCEDVKDDKFINAVNAYKLSYHGNMYGVASDYHLNEEDKMNLEILIRLYEKYSRNCQIELGNIIEENDNISKRGIK